MTQKRRRPRLNQRRVGSKADHIIGRFLKQEFGPLDKRLAREARKALVVKGLELPDSAMDCGLSAEQLVNLAAQLQYHSDDGTRLHSEKTYETIRRLGPDKGVKEVLKWSIGKFFGMSDAQLMKHGYDQVMKGIEGGQKIGVKDIASDAYWKDVGRLSWEDLAKKWMNDDAESRSQLPRPKPRPKPKKPPRPKMHMILGEALQVPQGTPVRHEAVELPDGGTWTITFYRLPNGKWNTSAVVVVRSAPQKDEQGNVVDGKVISETTTIYHPFHRDRRQKGLLRQTYHQRIYRPDDPVAPTDASAQETPRGPLGRQ